ncbi:uncharacterized protein LOC130980924 [Arachis stenosperma]|uniref:uncharacterized protein LOC130980924 n=1 Tax=Arachis stenosperma TaxID=217475 RepID=UPI0025AD3522|nr:uncharacterized protein LOC130980924 [Arachis stenosperma]
MKKVRWEECKAVTLANEKILEEDTSKPIEHSQGSSQNNLERKEQKIGSVQRKESTGKEIQKSYVPRAPFPQRLLGGEKERSYSKFLDVFASISVIIPFIKTLQQMPIYIKCMKELLNKKGTLKGGQTVTMNKECSALIKKDALLKNKDPRSFHIPCKLQINELRSTDVIIQLADKTQKQAEGVVENMLVKVGNYFLPMDFVILDMEESYLHPIILGRPFLAIARALIDVEQGDKLCLEESNSESAAEPLKQSLMNKQELQEIQPQESGKVANKDLPNTRVNGATLEEEKRDVKKLPRGWRNKKVPTECFSPGDKISSQQQGKPIGAIFDPISSMPKAQIQIMKIHRRKCKKIVERQFLGESKTLPPSLKYGYLGSNDIYSVIINTSLSEE